MNLEENLKRKTHLKKKGTKVQKGMKRKEELPIRSCIERDKKIILGSKRESLQCDKTLETVVTPIIGKKSRGESPQL